MSGHVRPCVARCGRHGHILSYMVICVIIHGHTWPYRFMYMDICVHISHHISPYVAIYGHVHGHMMAYLKAFGHMPPTPWQAFSEDVYLHTCHKWSAIGLNRVHKGGQKGSKRAPFGASRGAKMSTGSDRGHDWASQGGH